VVPAPAPVPSAAARFATGVLLADLAVDFLAVAPPSAPPSPLLLVEAPEAARAAAPSFAPFPLVD
jgi:hypothetical protein